MFSEVLQGSVDTSFGTGSATTGFPTKDYTFFNVPGTDISAPTSKLKDIAIGKDDLYAQILKPSSGDQTGFYKIKEMKKLCENPNNCKTSDELFWGLDPDTKEALASRSSYKVLSI